MKKLYPIGIMILLSLFLLPVLVNAAASVSISQSGADTSTVMKDRVFTVSVSGATANAEATISLPTGFSLTGENSKKTTDDSGVVSWTTVMASQKLSAQTISVSISGQGTPETATSSSFSVVLSPSLTTTVDRTSASVQQGSTFSLSLNIQNSGETTARFGTITASGSGLSISSGCSPSDISAGQSSGISCTIAASSSATTGTKTLTLTIAPSNTDTLTKTVSVTVTAAPTVTTVPSTGAGGVAGNVTVTTEKGKANITILTIAAGQTQSIAIEKTEDVAVTDIEITVKNAVSNVKIEIAKTGKPVEVTAEVDGMAYHYLTVSKENVEDADISKAKIKFKVEKSWVADNRINEATIGLYRWTGAEWDKLSTTKLSADDSYIYFEAESTALSIYVISGKVLPEVLECPACPEPSAWSDCINGKQRRTNYKCNVETNYECESYIEEQACKAKPEEKPLPLDRIIAIAIAVAVAAFTVWWYKIRRKTPWKTGLRKTFWLRKYLNPKTSEDKQKQS